jgi:hypothetical protein
LIERELFEDPGVDGNIILKWMGHGLKLSGAEWRQEAGCCECGNEP